MEIGIQEVKNKNKRELLSSIYKKQLKTQFKMGRLSNMGSNGGTKSKNSSKGRKSN